MKFRTLPTSGYGLGITYYPKNSCSGHEIVITVWSWELSFEFSR